MSETAFRHVEHFTNAIGPRGSATPAEKQAHDYCQSTLEALGYSVQREEFRSPLSGWHPSALALILMLLADLIFVLMGRGANAQVGALAAAALGLITLVSFALQNLHRDNPLRW